MGYVLFGNQPSDIAPPSTQVRLGDIEEGSIVYLNENGEPVEFIVAHHNYEEWLNDSGRTLLVRANCYDYRQWSSTDTEYENADINIWLNGEYKAVLDEAVQEAMGETTIQYTVGGEDHPEMMTEAPFSVFLLSPFEMLLFDLENPPENINWEGSELNTAYLFQWEEHEDISVAPWTRSPATDGTTHAFVHYGSTCEALPVTSIAGSRPAFTLPENAMFGKQTMSFEEVGA